MKYMSPYLRCSVLAIGVFVVFAGLLPKQQVLAATIPDLKQQIEDRNKQIEVIEQEIREYEEDLVEIGKEKQTLKGAIEGLDVSRRKIGADINLTENKIRSTSLEINRLALEIGEKETRIDQNLDVIAKTLRTLNQIESDSLIETVLAHDNLGEVWERIDTLGRFQQAMRSDITELLALKEDLGEKKDETEKRKEDLTGYRSQLSGQKKVLDDNRQEKDQLLAITENKEANYQQLLTSRQAAREQFERELLELESQLEFALDPSAIPPTGQGLLGWPIDDLAITQYFGDTPFANSGAYDGKGHNGVDFRASSGTRVKAALAGIVIGAGNTDAVPGCYSYGKWILLEHNNGLASLYAHLSAITASEGQSVKTGEVIGFSGNTGYSTGPHLHFTVYINDAVEIIRLGDIKAITNCAAARIPVAPLEAYLNPLDYLLDARSIPTA